MDQYQKLNLIGKGNFGTVNLYERIFDKKQFAIKKTFFKQEDNHYPLNEIKILESINHPNIIKYYDSFINNNKIIIVMEYACQGKNILIQGDLYKFLKEFKQQKQYISEEKIIEFINQLVSALNYLQEKKIIHRDIKLQNILVDKNGILKLGDFGISKQLDQSNELAKTSLGTPYYLSPEICLNQQYDHQNDMWMLGCALYELTAQEKPFQGDSLNKTRPESDKYGMLKNETEDIYNNRPKTFSFGKQLFNGFTPTSSQRKILLKEFLKKRLGDFRYQQIFNLINEKQSPLEFINEENQELVNLLGTHNIDSIKCFQILFQQPQQNENKKFNFQNYKF